MSLPEQALSFVAAAVAAYGPRVLDTPDPAAPDTPARLGRELLRLAFGGQQPGAGLPPALAAFCRGQVAAGNEHALIDLGMRLYLDGGDKDAAIACLRRAAGSADPDVAAEGQTELADMLWSRGDIDAGRAAYQAVIEGRHPEWAPRSPRADRRPSRVRPGEQITPQEQPPDAGAGQDLADGVAELPEGVGRWLRLRRGVFPLAAYLDGDTARDERRRGPGQLPPPWPGESHDGQRPAGPHQLAQAAQRRPGIGQVMEHGIGEHGIERPSLQRVSQDVALAPCHRHVREPRPGPAKHWAIDVDGYHPGDPPRQPGGQETVTATHVEHRRGRGRNAVRQPRVVMDIDVPQSLQARIHTRTSSHPVTPLAVRTTALAQRSQRRVYGPHKQQPRPDEMT